MNFIIFFGLMLGLVLVSMCAWVVLIRPVQLLVLARRRGFHYRWLIISRVSPCRWELKMNNLSSQNLKMNIYDTSYSKVTPSLVSRRTVMTINQRKYEVSDFLFGYAKISQIEKFILHHQALES